MKSRTIRIMSLPTSVESFFANSKLLFRFSVMFNLLNRELHTKHDDINKCHSNRGDITLVYCTFCAFSDLSFSIALSHVLNAFPYATSFSGSDSAFMAELISLIFASKVCSVLSRICTVRSLFSSSADSMITTGRLHFGQNVSFPFLNSGVPH